MTQTTAIFTALHRHGIVTDDEFPELTDAAKREELERRAAELALTLNYDEETGTATLFHADEAAEGGTKYHATILIAWVHLIWRKRQAMINPREGDWSALTTTKRRKNRFDREFNLTAQYLTTRYKHMYPRLRRATNALDRLVADGLLTTLGRDPVKYVATPLLSHVVDQETAVEIVWGHLQGSFKELAPLNGVDVNPHQRVLEFITDVAEGFATAQLIADQLDMTPKEVEGICTKLRDDGLVEHRLGTSQGGAWYRIFPDETGEEE